MTAWTATPQQVQRVVAAVLPHASDDVYLPAINCVQIELDGYSFRAVATDRYSVGICRGDLAEWDEDAKKVKKTIACLRPADLRRLFAFLRPNKSLPARWTLTEESLTVAIQDGDSLTLRTVQDIGFPNWRGILEEHAKVEARPGAHMGFTAGVVESFNKSAKVLGEYGLGWHFTSPLKPVLIQIGPDFLGLIMPRRVTDDPELDLGHFGVDLKAVAA